MFKKAWDGKKGADTGIDGRIYFRDEADTRSASKHMVVSVKLGNVSGKDVRNLHSVLEREQAALGAFISLRTPAT